MPSNGSSGEINNKKQQLKGTTIDISKTGSMKKGPSNESLTSLSIDVKSYKAKLKSEPKKDVEVLEVVSDDEPIAAPIQVDGKNDITNDSIVALPADDAKVRLGSGVTRGVLGQGGMTRVYKIWNGTLEMERAVKIPLPTGNSDSYDRFTTEMKICSRLDHPNIIKIFSVGEWNKIPYIEMEYINGVALDELIRTHGQLPPAVCCAIALGIAKALKYAHKHKFQVNGKTYQGIIHRDLKPANIMVSKDGNVKLMDFGIARPLETGIHTITDGNIVGTMQYFSPEQLDNNDLDCRTDIYALGAILYEMLTGQKAFPVSTLTMLIKKKMLNEYKDFDEFDGLTISSLLKEIARKCLNKEKDTRFQNSEELVESLKEALPAISVDSAGSIMNKFMSDPIAWVTDWHKSPRTRLINMEDDVDKPQTSIIKLASIVTGIASASAALIFLIIKLIS